MINDFCRCDMRRSSYLISAADDLSSIVAAMAESVLTSFSLGRVNIAIRIASKACA